MQNMIHTYVEYNYIIYYDMYDEHAARSPSAPKLVTIGTESGLVQNGFSAN